MDKNQKTMIINNSISLGLQLLGGVGSRTLREHFNASLANDPTYCMRLQFMALINSDDFSDWLRSKGKTDLFNRIQKYKIDLNQDPENANYNLANDLYSISSNSHENAARILSAASMSLFYNDEGVIGASHAMARVELDALFESEYVSVVDLCAGASFRFSILLFFALWIINYDGVYEALCELLPKERSLMDDEKAALKTEKRATPQDLNTWIKIATNFYKDLGFSTWDEYNPIAFILRLLLEYRENAASVIVKRHPEFATMESEIKKTNNYLLNSSSFNDEYYSELKKNLEALGDINQSNQSLHDDIYFSVFMAAHGSFLFQGDAEFWQQHVEKLFSVDEEIRGWGHMAMIVVLLWSSNYHDFQARLHEAVVNISKTSTPSAESSESGTYSEPDNQASFRKNNSLKFVSNTSTESVHSELNTNSTVQNQRRRRSDRYNNETSSNTGTKSNVEKMSEYNSVQSANQVVQNDRRPIVTSYSASVDGSSKSTSISNSNTVSEQNSLVQEADLNDFKQLLKTVPAYFKDKKSLGVIIGTTIIFSMIFGFSLFKVVLGVVMGIAAVYFLKKKNIYLRSSERNSYPYMQINNSIIPQSNNNTHSSQTAKTADIPDENTDNSKDRLGR